MVLNDSTSSSDEEFKPQNGWIKVMTDHDSATLSKCFKKINNGPCIFYYETIIPYVKRGSLYVCVRTMARIGFVISITLFLALGAGLLFYLLTVIDDTSRWGVLKTLAFGFVFLVYFNFIRVICGWLFGCFTANMRFQNKHSEQVQEVAGMTIQVLNLLKSKRKNLKALYHPAFTANCIHVHRSVDDKVRDVLNIFLANKIDADFVIRNYFISFRTKRTLIIIASKYGTKEDSAYVISYILAYASTFVLLYYMSLKSWLGLIRSPILEYFDL